MKAVSFKETVVLRRWESSDEGLTLETSALKVLITLSTSLIISNHLKKKKKKNNKAQYSLTDNTRHNMHSCHSKKTRQPQSMKKNLQKEHLLGYLCLQGVLFLWWSSGNSFSDNKIQV